MAENFTAKQKEIVARKLGYDGPMQGFDDFLNSSPALGMKYAALSDKFATRMAKGGVVRKKFQEGGAVPPAEETAYLQSKLQQLKSDPAAAQQAKDIGWSGETTDDLKNFLASRNLTPEQHFKLFGTKEGLTYQGIGNVTTAASTAATKDASGAPMIPGATSVTAEQTATPTPIATTTAGTTQAAGVTNVAAPATVAAPKPIAAPVAVAAKSADAVKAGMTNLEAEQGTVSEASKVVAAEQEPTTTAIADIEAAQGVAGTVQNAPTRTVQEGEMVSGSAVDMARAEETMAKTQAAQGTVTEEMTVQGQLNKMLTGFDAGAPPPWAAASMRTATAQMAARGLGASSLAGQAIIQAALEAATPIAAADAKVFETMGLQNLSNRQQIAVLTGQQRATFLGQEFDQAFQTRVLNAAKVSDIANKNFDSQTQIAIENARLTNSMDIANLSARNAVVLAKAAQIANLETTNLNNRQQAAVENAKAFLTMDVKNLDNRQQTALFKAQELNDALVSDAGFANAVSITNAQNKLEADKISASLALSAAQFNAAERNKVAMANANAANEMTKFNAQEANNRAEFNSRMAAEINVANAKILADVSTANTAAVNAANAVTAKNATELSASTYAQQSQTYRDLLSYSWKTGESDKDRISNLAVASIQKDVANIKADGETSNAIGGFFVEAAKNITVQDVKDGWKWLTGP